MTRIGVAPFLWLAFTSTPSPLGSDQRSDPHFRPETECAQSADGLIKTGFAGKDPPDVLLILAHAFR